MNTSEFKSYLAETKEYGVVFSIEHPVVKVRGLPGAKINEIVVFENDEIGHISAIKSDYVEVVCYSKAPVIPGCRLTRSNKVLSISIGADILGKAVDPFCRSLSDSSEQYVFTENVETLEVDISPVPLTERVRIKRQLLTGVTVMDTLVPLGKGQRELVVGERKTGKTSVILTIIKTQVQQGSVVVYANIGKEKTVTKRLLDYCSKNDILNSVVIVSTSADDAPSLVDLTPYSAMTIAEYFRRRGKDVLIVFDDMTNHAKYYREITLLSRRFPGRDSYPGDIFYKHARLLERAGNYKCTDGCVTESAITALALAETSTTTLSDYIVSNLISITDGHLYFDEKLFNKGIRPSVDIFLSVTRVGKQTQDPLLRYFNREVMQLMSRYDKSSVFKHFGSELTDEVKALLLKGDQVYSLIEQSYQRSMPVSVQKVLWGMLFANLFAASSSDDVKRSKRNLYQSYKIKDTKLFIDKLVDETDPAKYLKQIMANRDQIIKLCSQVQD